MRPLHAGSLLVSRDVSVDPQPGPCGPAAQSNDTVCMNMSLQATACGCLAVSMPVGLHYVHFLTLALALRELHAGVFILASFDAGKP